MKLKIKKLKPEVKLPSYAKECEFRFNHRDGRMYKVLLTELRKRPLGE